MNFFQSVFDSINKDLREFEKDFQKFFDTLDDRQPERWRPNFWHFLWKWERRRLKMPDQPARPLRAKWFRGRRQAAGATHRLKPFVRNGLVRNDVARE